MTYLADFGPFFGVDTHQSTDPLTAPWINFAALLSSDGELLTARVRRVQAALGLGAQTDVDIRIAASVAHLGLVARVLAPTLAARALGDPPISLAPGDLWWQDELGGPYPLSVTSLESRLSPGESATTDCAGSQPVATQPDAIQPDAIAALTEAMSARFGVSARTLSGNVASAANSAARLIGDARPALTDAARAAADEILADPRIEDGVLRAGPGFRRNSCCLIYRVSGSRDAVCGDCVLV